MNLLTLVNGLRTFVRNIDFLDFSNSAFRIRLTGTSTADRVVTLPNDTVTLLGDDRPIGTLNAGVSLRGYEPIITVTATKTLALSDSGTVQNCINAAAAIVTIPLNSAVLFPIGAKVIIRKTTSQTVTIAWSAGVTVLNAMGSTLTVTSVTSVMYLRKTDTDTWITFLDLPETAIGGALRTAVDATSAKSTIGLANVTNVPLSEPRSSGMAIGTQSGISTTTSTAWIAIGPSAARTNSTGSFWTAIGSGAGYSATAGYWTAIGSEAAYTCTSNNWTAIGAYAARSTTTGSNWTAIGAYASFTNTTGSSWTAIGRTAGFGNLVGSSWCAVGTSAGYNSTGDNWTAIGTNAGFDVTTGISNTMIGYNAGRGVTTGSGNTVIGTGVVGLSATLTNNVILASGDGAIKLQINSSGQTSVASFLATSTTVSTSTTTGSIQTSGVGIGGGRGSFSLATSYDDSATASQTNRSLYFNNGNTWAKRGDGSNVALTPLSLAAPVAVANVVTIPFDGVTTLLNQYNVTAPVTLTPASTRIQGASTMIVVSADGMNTPTLAAGILLFSDSATYINVAGTLHVYTFYELGGTVWVRLSR